MAPLVLGNLLMCDLGLTLELRIKMIHETEFTSYNKELVETLITKLTSEML